MICKCGVVHRCAELLTKPRLGVFPILAFTLLLGTVTAAPAAAQLLAPTDCQIDLQGVNDEGGPTAQGDLTQFCVEVGDGSPFDLHSKWNWDNTGTTQSVDACTLYDTDEDGNANLAVCETGEDDPIVQVTPNPRLFLCGDDRPDRCSEADLQINTCGIESNAPTCLTDADCAAAGDSDACGVGVCVDGGGARTNQGCLLDTDCGSGETCDTSTAGSTASGEYATVCEVTQTPDDPFPGGLSTQTTQRPSAGSTSRTSVIPTLGWSMPAPTTRGR